MSPTPEGMRRITVEVPASLHAQFKAEVNRLGLDIRAVVMPLVKAWLAGETKIKTQPRLGQRFETIIHPGDAGWEKSVEKLVYEILKSHKREEMKEAEATGPVKVHTVEEPAEVEELALEEIEEPEEAAEPIELEETEEPVEAENPEDLKPKKKKRVGVWPWTRMVDVEEEPEKEKPEEEEPKKKSFWKFR